MGCTRPFTYEDFEQIKESLRNQSTDKNGFDIHHERQRAETLVVAGLHEISNLNADTLRSISRETLHTILPNLVDILEKPGSLENAVVKEMLHTIFTTERLEMTKREEKMLPDALRVILKNTSNPLGLFQRAPEYRGKGSAAVSHHYELLSTAALMKQTYTSQSGKRLSISSMDRIDFGIKFPWHYAHSVTKTESRDTIEADTLIHKPDNRVIAIDAKYCRSGKYPTNKDDLAEVLSGIRSSFRAGDFDEYFYVCNREFSPGFKKFVQSANLEIATDYVKSKYKLYKDVTEGIRTEAERDALSKEGQSSLADKPDWQLFKAHNESFQKFANDYHIPQIEICEFVNYPGT